MIVIINGKVAASLFEGQSFCATIVDLQSVELLCQGKDDSESCIGEFKIVLHFQSAVDECDLENVKCFLSDCHGHPLYASDSCSFICEEISNKRKSFQVALPNGKIKRLNKVVVQKKGFITIQLFNKTGNLCKTCTIPFTEIETILLCAPPGTKLECEILSFDCEAYVIAPADGCTSFVEIIIVVSICQSIQTKAAVIMEIEGVLCKKST
ncbi:S-Ena type endospore appendage [Ectobacillus funiculus]